MNLLSVILYFMLIVNFVLNTILVNRLFRFISIFLISNFNFSSNPHEIHCDSREYWTVCLYSPRHFTLHLGLWFSWHKRLKLTHCNNNNVYVLYVIPKNTISHQSSNTVYDMYMSEISYISTHITKEFIQDHFYRT